MAGIRTATLAEIQARQGHLDLACSIYDELLRARPDDEGLRARRAELEALRSAKTDAGRREAKVDRLRTLLRRVRKRAKRGGS